MLACYHPVMQQSDDMMSFGIKVFVVLWIVFVPIVITSRLEKIIKLLEDKNKS